MSANLLWRRRRVFQGRYQVKKFEHLGSMCPGKLEAVRRGLIVDATFPKIICLCGSTRFADTFNRINRELTLMGYIVLSVGCHIHSDKELQITMEQKIQLDELHKRKIDLADAVMILNVDYYIGESTKSEISYATKMGKRVGYLWAEATMPQKELKKITAELLN
jgi:hypothetical protein